MVDATLSPSKVLTSYGDKASFTCTVQGPGNVIVEALLFNTATSLFTKDSTVQIVYQRFTNGTFTFYEMLIFTSFSGFILTEQPSLQFYDLRHSSLFSSSFKTFSIQVVL